MTSASVLTAVCTKVAFRDSQPQRQGGPQPGATPALVLNFSCPKLALAVLGSAPLALYIH